MSHSRILAESITAPLFQHGLFDQIFDEECVAHRVLPSYRTEAVRLELRRNFEGFLDDKAFERHRWTILTEQQFEFALGPGLSIRGRIDRLERGPKGEALVIDYKYSAAQKIRDRVEESGAGDKVQAGLYLVAARKQFDMKPAGMLFCGLKKEVVWEGWHVSIPGLEAVGTA